MGNIFSCFGLVARVDAEENVNRRSGSINCCCGCFHSMINALANKREIRFGSKESNTESCLKDLSVEEERAAEPICCSSEEYDNECPICLEEFTQENPIISTKCSHAYHLGCLYEWEKRSNSCPICGRAMVFAETV